MEERARVGFLNTQGFLAKKATLLTTIKEEKISVLCLAETWLRPSAVMTLAEHHCFSRPRPILAGRNQARGGVAVIVHNTLPATFFTLPQDL